MSNIFTVFLEYDTIFMNTYGVIFMTQPTPQSNTTYLSKKDIKPSRTNPFFNEMVTTMRQGEKL